VQVGVFGGQLGQCRQLVRAAQLRLVGRGEVQEVLRVRRVPVFALLGAERADGLQHPVPAAAELDEGLLDQAGQHGFGVGDGADAVDGGRPRAAGEHREPGGQELFVRVQEAPAPFDDATQGAVPRLGGPVAA
jgi:hypothetical protein